MAKRFFVNEKDIQISDNNIGIIGEEVHHINVLRHKIGDEIRINEFLVEIITINQNQITGIIKETENNETNTNVAITLYQSYIKSDKMEFVIQKAVELGVSKIVPFLSKNCVVKLDDKDKLKKVERLNKISIEASKQCNRNDIVQVEDIIDIKDKEMFISSLNSNDVNIFAYEKSNRSLKDVILNIQSKYENQKISIGIIIGPEGGFDTADIETILKANNIYEVSLGKRILRAETASLNLLSILNYIFEN